VQQLEKEKLSRSQPAPSTQNTGNQGEIERYKSALRILNQKKGDLEKQFKELQLEHKKSLNNMQDKDNVINKLRMQINYLNEEKKALEETFQDFASAGISNEKAEQYEKQVKSQQQDIEVLQREVAGLKSEKKILHSQVEQMGQELSAMGGKESVPQLKLRILQLEAENESGNVKIRRLIAAIKADRTQNEEKMKEAIAERDEQEQRADRFESKMVQLIEMVRTERKKRQDDNMQTALDAARQTLKDTEVQIRQANEAASAAERALQQKEMELQKVLLFGKKKSS